jgi:hypothetical protein
MTVMFCQTLLTSANQRSFHIMCQVWFRVFFFFFLLIIIESPTWQKMTGSLKNNFFINLTNYQYITPNLIGNSLFFDLLDNTFF